MSRFKIVTVLTAVVLAIIALTSAGRLRWCLIAVVLFAYLGLIILGVVFIQMRFFCNALCRLQNAPKRVVLTFDDGPDPAVTAILLDKLKQLQIKAAFFCIGQKVINNPEIARRIADEGHILGNHSFHHNWYTNFLFGKYLFCEIEQTQKAIKNITGSCPVFFRPPMGLTNPHYNGILQKFGLTVVGWDVRSLDYCALKPETVIERIIKNTRDGSIIVLHDGCAQTQFLLEVLTAVVQQLRERGYTFVNLKTFYDNNA